MCESILSCCPQIIYFFLIYKNVVPLIFFLAKMHNSDFQTQSVNLKIDFSLQHPSTRTCERKIPVVPVPRALFKTFAQFTMDRNASGAAVILFLVFA